MPGPVFARRLQALDKETSFEILARARALEAKGHDIIHLEIGEPDFETPRHIKAAAKEAIERGFTHYGPSPGLPEAREAIAQHVSRDRGVGVERDQVVITPGGKSVIFFSMLALVEPGDEVIYPNPGFPNYEMTIELLGGKPVPIRIEEERGFTFDLEQFGKLVTPRTRLCILNSPHNPTGGVLPSDLLEGVAELAERHDFMVLSDEIYSKITYDGEHTSFYSIPGVAERTILVDGHSKTYAMTGWRLGYGVMPRDVAVQVARIAGNSTSCTCTFTQLAGIEALRGPQDAVTKMVAEFRERRDLVVDGLARVPGFRCHKPAGAFYVFPNIEGTGRTSKELAALLMEEAGVAVLAGGTFGSFGEGYIRISYANCREALTRAIERMTAALS
ncbi:MAG: pyridoxal phosphate-dependent aminotransferase [Candidatus Krumholzibacteriia bacterium]